MSRKKLRQNVRVFPFWLAFAGNIGYDSSVMFTDSQRKHGQEAAGQAMVEYVIVFAALLSLVAVMALCLYAVRQQSNRALDLVASEYP